MLVLSQDQVKGLLNLDELVDALAIAMADLSSGKASVPARIAALVEEQGALLGAMPAYCPSSGALGAKLVSLFPRNASGAVPTHQAVIVLFEPTSGSPVALMDGTHITAARTAGGSALATKLIARPDSHVLAILGTGVQAWAHAHAIPRVRPITAIRIAGRNKDKCEHLAEQLGKELAIETRVSTSWAEAMDGADIVCATTHPHEPVVKWEWIRPGAHVNSVGMSANGFEIDLETIRESRIFVEQRAAASAPMPTGSGDIHLAVQSGQKTLDSLTEIGELVLGSKEGRRTADEVTLYKSVGVAAQDVAAAGLVLKRARESNVGLEVTV